MSTKGRFGLVVSLFRPFCARRQAPQDPGFRPLAPTRMSPARAAPWAASRAGPRRSGQVRRPWPRRHAARPRRWPPRKPGMPWASSPSTMPPSTSPVPAVASHGLVVALIDAIPSGAATTVSAPFKAMIAPDRAAACARPLELRQCGKVAEQPRELPVMRREHDRRGARGDRWRTAARDRRRTR